MNPVEKSFPLNNLPIFQLISYVDKASRVFLDRISLQSEQSEELQTKGALMLFPFAGLAGFKLLCSVLNFS